MKIASRYQKLIDSGLVSKERLIFAMKEAKAFQTDLYTMLIQLRFCSNDDISELMSKSENVTTVDISSLDIPREVLEIVEEYKARELQMLPIAIDGNKLRCVVEDISNFNAPDWVERNTSYDFEPFLATGMRVEDGISKYYSTSISVEDYLKNMNFNLRSGSQEEEDLLKEQMKEFVDQIILEGIRLKATDIHIEPDFNVLRLRYRIDGDLSHHIAIPKSGQDRVIATMKLKASLQSDEKFKPQDGRADVKYGTQNIDLRVSCMPVEWGENIVIRILDPENTKVKLSELGMPDYVEDKFRETINMKDGILLVTGPTGSGKTTSLYAGMGVLDSVTKNVCTLEDPVEYKYPLLRQTSITPKIKFADGLKALLRQDPDVILVGEIRDGETATLAIEASNTGHMVMATLHTNSAVDSLARLIDLGVQPFLLASTIRGIVAQRLLKKLCPRCCEEKVFDKETLIELLGKECFLRNLSMFFEDEDDFTFNIRGNGCELCKDSGYIGRVGIYELMYLERNFEEFYSLKENQAKGKILEFIREHYDFKSIRDDAVQKSIQGICSIYDASVSGENG